MIMLIALGSILIITSVVSLLRQILPFSVCPICAGVSLTWLSLLILWFIGFPIDIRVPAILMGGSIVGIAYQSERYLLAIRSPLLWKSLFIPIGFAFVFTIIDRQWGVAISILIVLGLIALWFFAPTKAPGARAATLEQRMKNCC